MTETKLNRGAREGLICNKAPWWSVHRRLSHCRPLRQSQPELLPALFIYPRLLSSGSGLPARVWRVKMGGRLHIFRSISAHVCKVLTQLHKRELRPPQSLKSSTAGNPRDLPCLRPPSQLLGARTETAADQDSFLLGVKRKCGNEGRTGERTGNTC